jgi:plasmid stability protein
VAAVSIRNLDDAVRDHLRLRAAANGRSMEAEMRAILMEAVEEPDEDQGIVGALMKRFSQLGGVELGFAPRRELPRAAEFSE